MCLSQNKKINSTECHHNSSDWPLISSHFNRQYTDIPRSVETCQNHKTGYVETEITTLSGCANNYLNILNSFCSLTNVCNYIGL